MDYLTYLDRIKKLAKTTDGKLSFIYWLTEYDYINILKIMVIVILKINEEFCLMNPA